MSWFLCFVCKFWFPPRRWTVIFPGKGMTKCGRKIDRFYEKIWFTSQPNNTLGKISTIVSVLHNFPVESFKYLELNFHGVEILLAVAVAPHPIPFVSHIIDHQPMRSQLCRDSTNHWSRNHDPTHQITPTRLRLQENKNNYNQNNKYKDSQPTYKNI